jgi:hypothetical protein
MFNGKQHRNYLHNAIITQGFLFLEPCVLNPTKTMEVHYEQTR